MGLLKTKKLVDNEQYEFKFEVKNIGNKPLPGGIIEFHDLPVSVKGDGPHYPKNQAIFYKIILIINL